MSLGNTDLCYFRRLLSSTPVLGIALQPLYLFLYFSQLYIDRQIDRQIDLATQPCQLASYRCIYVAKSIYFLGGCSILCPAGFFPKFLNEVHMRKDAVGKRETVCSLVLITGQIFVICHIIITRLRQINSPYVSCFSQLVNEVLVAQPCWVECSIIASCNRKREANLAG